MKTLIVEKSFPYDGKQRKKGDKIQATNSHARILCMAGKAHEFKEVVQEPAPPVITPPLARRDMRAEDETDRNTLALPRGRGRGGNARGRYARSDMRAEK